MAEFGIQATELSAPQGAGNTVLNPATTMPLDNGVGENISNFFNIFQKGLERDQKQRSDQLKMSIIKDYSRQQQAINDAIDSGGLAGDAAVRRSRILFNKFMGAYPEFEKELTGVATAFKGFSQVGEAQEQVKTEEDLRKSLIREAQAAGAMPVDAGLGRTAQDAYIRAYQTDKAAQEAFMRTVRKNEEARASGRYSNDLIDRDLRDTSARLLNDLTNTHLDKIYATAEDLRSRIKGGGLDKLTAEGELNKQFSKIEQSIAAIASKNPELVSMYRGIFDDARKAALTTIDPANDAKAYKDAFDATLYKTKLLAMEQPGVASRVAVSQLFGNDPSLVLQLTGQSGKLISTLDSFIQAPNGKAITPQVTGTPDDKPVLDFLRKNMQMYNSGTVKDSNGTKQELTNGIKSYLKQLGKLQNEDGLDPKQLQAAVDFFSSADYRKFAQENKLSASELSPAMQTFQLHYMNSAVDTIGNSLENIVTTRSEYIRDPKTNEQKLVLKDEKLDMDQLQVEFDGVGVSFKMPGYSNNPAMQSAQRKALSEMNNISKAVNKLINLGANMEGKDPAKYWEERKYDLLPKVFPIRPGTVINGYKFTGQGSWRDKASYTKVGGDDE